MEQYLPGKNTIIMTRDQVRKFDNWAINTIGIPGIVLMENAGRSCAELIIEKLNNVKNPKVTIFCGTGNNGGDGYVIARHLLNHKLNVRVIICGQPEKIKGDAKANLDVLKTIGIKSETLDINANNVPQQVAGFTNYANAVVDAIFGSGLQGQLSEQYKQLIESINNQNLPIFAVDIPSGLDCDSAIPLGAAIKANYTVTFVAVKKGFTSPHAQKFTGDIYIASIGIDVSLAR